MASRTLTVAGATLICMAMTLRTTAAVTYYTDENAYLTALATSGYVAVSEGFEDDAAWGAVRSTVIGGPQTAPSVSNLDITWTSSSVNNAVTTSSGAARTGQWGFYSLPHGDYANGITDGWRGSAAQPLVAIGGWVRTNTPFAALVVFLDGNEQNPIDFDGDNVLSGPYRFFGVIEPAGFSTFDFRETEGTIGDQKYIFGDDFTFAFGGVIQDCNANGIADAFDVAAGTSADCNNNIIPDECEIDADSQAPGGPFYCTQDCAADCNDNGLLDACEAVVPDVYASGELSPIGNGAPQTFTIPSPPQTRADVIMRFTAYANLGGGPDDISVSINSVPVGAVFGQNDGSDCPETGPDEASLIVPMETFNDAVNGGDAVINLVASDEVDPEGCDLPTFVTVEVELFIPSPADADGNGILDVCECPGDVDGDGGVGFSDILAIIGAWGPCGAPCPEDLSGNGTVDFADILAVIAAWGPCS